VVPNRSWYSYPLIQQYLGQEGKFKFITTARAFNNVSKRKAVLESLLKLVSGLKVTAQYQGLVAYYC
jgi:hypothetical protein